MPPPICWISSDYREALEIPLAAQHTFFRLFLSQQSFAVLVTVFTFARRSDTDEHRIYNSI